MDADEVDALGRTVIDHVAELVVVLDQSGIIRYANRRAEVLLGAKREDWLGRTAFELIHPDDLPLALELLVSAQATGPGVKEPVQYRLRAGDGDWLLLEVIASMFELDSGETAIVITGREMAARRGPDLIVNEVGERLARMFDDAACGMTQTSLTGELLRVNRSFATMLGYQPEDLLGRSFASLSHPDDRDGDLTRFRSLLSGEVATYRSSKRYLARTGEIVHAELTVSMVLDRAGAPLYCATQTIDVTELRMAQAELMHRSTHDTLTGLANRSLFHTLVDQSLSRASRSGDLVAALFVDLDGFKSINDRFGHSVGDELLVLVAHRLRSAMRHGDVVARFGGDEFVVLCEHCSVTAAVAASQRIIDAVSAPFRIGDISVVIGASVGVAVEPAQLVSADLLLMHADVALYEAKRGGRGKIAIHA